MRLPVDQTGLKVTALFDEPRVVVVPADHRLAGKPALHLADLADETLLQPADAVPEWRALTGDTAPGHAPFALAAEEKLEHVAAGRGIVVLPRSTAAFHQRPDVSAIPVTDIGPSRVTLAWDATRRSRLLTEFADLTAIYRTKAGD